MWLSVSGELARGLGRRKLRVGLPFDDHLRGLAVGELLNQGRALVHGHKQQRLLSDVALPSISTKVSA